MKFIGIKERIKNCRFYQIIISNNGRELKWKLNQQLLKSEDFSAQDLRLKISHNLIFHRLVNPLLTKTVIILFKNDTYRV